MKVLYVNHGHDERCGVHDLGRRHAAAIASPTVNVEYVECNSMTEVDTAWTTHVPNVVIVNYMPGIMPWVTTLRDLPSPAIAVIHNYQDDTLDQVTASHLGLFHYVLVLEPGLSTCNPRVLVTSRPLPWAVHDQPLPSTPRIGSFGFAFPHKNFPAVAAEIAATFSEATFDLHMPEAYFNGAGGGDLYGPGIMDDIRKALNGPGLDVHRTTGHLPAGELVRRLSGNHVNCLLYVPGQHNAGLSSALDYLVAARRPILATDCAMFRHLRHGISTYPDVRLADIMDNYDAHHRTAMNLYLEQHDAIRSQTSQHLERIL